MGAGATSFLLSLSYVIVIPAVGVVMRLAVRLMVESGQKELDISRNGRETVPIVQPGHDNKNSSD